MSSPAAPVEIGLGLQSDKPPGEYARLAVLAEQAGFDVVSVYSDLLYAPPVVALLEIARATQRIRLGAACWNPYTMHPYEIAGQLAALDAASGGRAYLGLARGTWLDRIGIEQPRPVEYLRQAVALIRALLSGDRAGIEADLFPLAPGTALRYPTPDQPPPVLIGTWGVRTAALAGEIADEVKVGGSANPSMVGVMRARISVGAGRVGRPANAVGIVLGAVTVVDLDCAAARALARREVAMYLAVVAELDPGAELDQGLLEVIKHSVHAGDLDRAAHAIPDDILDLFAYAGDPEYVAELAQRGIDAGARRIEFGTPHGVTPEAGLHLLGSRVLPLLRR